MVVEGDPAPDSDPSLRSSFPSVQIDTFILQGPPEAFDEDVVDAPALAIHRDLGADPFQSVGPGEGRELRSLIGIHDLGRAELMDRLVHGLDAEVGFQRVRDAPGQNLPGEPVHDCDQVKEALSHRQVGNVGAPDLVGPLHPQPAQQIGIGLVALRGLAGVRLLVDRHQAHEPHQSPDALVIHKMALVLQVPLHLLHAAKRCLEELLVNHDHEVEVHHRLPHQLVVERRPRDGQQAALRPDRQARVVLLNHATPHLPVQGLSFRDKKSLATASSPIFACSARTVSSSTSGAFVPPRSKMSAASSSSAFFHWWIIVGCTPYSAASSDTVPSPFTAYSATRALNPASWFLRFFMS